MTLGTDFQRLLSLATAEHMRESESFKWSLGAELPCFVAEMDFQPAPQIREALSKWANEGWFGYMPPALIRNFQESIARYYQGLGQQQDPSLVRPVSDLVTLFHAVIDYFLDPEDPIVLMAPTYMNFVAAANNSGHPVRTVDMIRNHEECSWTVDWDALENALSDGGLLVLVNPHNPIGKSYSRAELERIAHIAAKHGARVLADEIHAPLTFEPASHVPFATVSAEAASISMTAFSVTKAFSIPGTKAAALLLTNPADLMTWKQHCTHLEFGTATSGLVATIAALEEVQDWFVEVLAYLDQNRQTMAALLKEHLPEAIFVKPEATYLSWLDLRPTKNYSRYAATERTTLARNIANNTGVLATDGLECGSLGEGHIRVNFATHRDTLVEIVERLGKILTQ